METLWQDLKYAARQLARNPGFTAVAVLTLALGIGANTAIFSVVDSVLLRPYPYRNPERLVTIYRADADPYWLSAPEFLDYRERQRSLQDLAVGEAFERGLNLTGAGEPVHVYTHIVSANFFSVLGTEAMLGRAFTEGGQAGDNRVVVLRYDFWRRQFGGDPSIVGRTVNLNDEGYTVLGVMPPGFLVPLIVNDVWVPLALDPANPGSRWTAPFFAIARLKSGVTREQAGEDVRRIAQTIASDYPDVYPQERAHTWAASVRPFGEYSSRYVRSALLILMGSVGFVLLIACVNVANLLLVRASSRGKEVAIRMALGAGRRRIIRQLLTETAMLSLAGGLAGVLLAYWGLDLVRQFAPTSITEYWAIELDTRVLAFASALALLTGAIFGLAPAFHSSRLDLQESLREGGRSSGAAGRARLRNLLVVTEVALSLMLLVGAGLLIQTFHNLLTVDAGFQTENVQTFRIWPSETRYAERSQVVAFYDDILREIRALPGVKVAGAASRVQLSGTSSRQFMPEGMPPNSPEYDIPFGLVPTRYRGVIPGYFEALEIPLLQGRFLSESDVDGAPRVVVVDESFARAAWPGKSSFIGRRVAAPDLDHGQHQWWTVVGVVRHARSLRVEQRDEQRELPEVYFPQAQGGWRVMHVVVKTSVEPSALLPAIRQAVASVDPNTPIYQVREMDYYVSHRVSRPRFYAFLMGMFSLLAMILASVGLYGVIAYSVSQRTQEIGIRIALGAAPWRIIGMVVRQGLTLILIGLVLGSVGALALTRLLANHLFGVSPDDPLTFAGVAILLAGIALLACYIPARRAARVDPMTALRYE